MSLHLYHLSGFRIISNYCQQDQMPYDKFAVIYNQGSIVECLDRKPLCDLLIKLFFFFLYVRPRTESRSGSVRSGRTTISLVSEQVFDLYSVSFKRTTISLASEQVFDLYSVSFKRSDSVRALTYKRLPTVLIRFAHGGARDEVSQ